MTVKLSISILCCLMFFVETCESKHSGQQSSTQSSTSSNATTAAGAPSTSPASPASIATVATIETIETIETNAKPQPGTNTGKATPALDACSLIAKSEIESVQRGKLQGTVPSKRDGGGALTISQCYYTVFSADGKQNLSVHLEVTQNYSTANGQDPLGDFWRKFEEAKASRKADKPMPVAGLGSGAFWVGNTKIGSLYALKGGKLLRISLGGPDDGKKIEKSKSLAAKALTRLG